MPSAACVKGQLSWHFRYVMDKLPRLCTYPWILQFSIVWQGSDGGYVFSDRFVEQLSKDFVSTVALRLQFSWHDLDANKVTRLFAISYMQSVTVHHWLLVTH